MSEKGGEGGGDEKNPPHPVTPTDGGGGAPQRGEKEKPPRPEVDGAVPGGSGDQPQPPTPGLKRKIPRPTAVSDSQRNRARWAAGMPTPADRAKSYSSAVTGRPGYTPPMSATSRQQGAYQLYDIISPQMEKCKIQSPKMQTNRH